MWLGWFLIEHPFFIAGNAPVIGNDDVDLSLVSQHLPNSTLCTSQCRCSGSLGVLVYVFLKRYLSHTVNNSFSTIRLSIVLLFEEVIALLLNVTMATKRAMPDAQKKAEGEIIKRLWLDLGEAKGFTQTEFCDSLGWNQGQLQQWFKGKTPISLEKLVNLSLALGFDPREVRPSIQSLYDRLGIAFLGHDNQQLTAQLDSVSPEAKESIRFLLEALEELRDSKQN